MAGIIATITDGSVVETVTADEGSSAFAKILERVGTRYVMPPGEFIAKLKGGETVRLGKAAFRWDPTPDSATVALWRLESRGFQFAAGDNGALIVQPASKLSDIDRETITKHKAAILEILKVDSENRVQDRNVVIRSTIGLYGGVQAGET